MRICLLTYMGNPYCGGQGVYVHYLAREFQRMGHEVEVIAGPPYPELTEGVILHPIESLSVCHPGNSAKANLRRVRNPLDLYEVASTQLGFFTDPLSYSFRAYSRLKELLKERHFDIIHDNQGLGYGLLSMKRLGVPVVATIHHPLTIDELADLEQASGTRQRMRIRRFYWLTRMQGFVARRMERIITVSQSAARDIERFFKVRPDKIRVVYNGTDTEIYKRDETVSREKHTLIVVGNTDDRKKGVLYLLKALQALRDDGVKLRIVDDAERRSADDAEPVPSYASELTKKFKLDGMVHFTGKVTREELVRLYSAAQIAIVPSLYEGFGLPAAEAMSCGTPLIATNGGALPEVVGDAGMLVPAGDADALAAAIKRLLNDEEAQRRMSEAGRRRVEQNFSWEQAAQKTLEVYQEVLRK